MLIPKITPEGLSMATEINKEMTVGEMVRDIKKEQPLYWTQLKKILKATRCSKRQKRIIVVLLYDLITLIESEILIDQEFYFSEFNKLYQENQAEKGYEILDPVLNTRCLGKDLEFFRTALKKEYYIPLLDIVSCSTDPIITLSAVEYAIRAIWQQQRENSAIPGKN